MTTINIILILALLQYISNFIFGFKSPTLSCGIFGQATNEAANLDVNGVHILGIYNIERGKMSCGLSWDGDIHYGLGFDKLYTDFIKNRVIEPNKFPIMIGHTRQPSYGFAVTEQNSHPFGFGENEAKDSYAMIFCHNGTLKNHEKLAKKYDIEIKEESTKYLPSGAPYTTTRNKIDSEILGEILYKTKSFEVLGEYVGAAALAWTWVDEPNKLYLWSGASRHTQNSFVKTETEERPMNVYQKDKNNMFFSSIKDSLTVLGASSKNDLQIDYNTVYIITDGDFENAEKIYVSRENAGQNEATITTSRHNYHNDWDYRDYCDYEDFNKKIDDKKDVKFDYSLNNLHDDKTLKLMSDYKDKVYSKSLRYWQKGSLINGVYIYIKNYGFKLAGVNHENAVSFINSIKGNVFDVNTGCFNYIMKEGYIPFDKDIKSVQFHYFTDGVLLKTLEDFNQCLHLKKELNLTVKHISANVISYMSKHPVIDMDPNKEALATLNGDKFTGNMTELGFEKVYYFNNGKLVKWGKRQDLNNVIQLPVTTVVKKEEVKPSFNEEILKDSVKNIEKLEENISKEAEVQKIEEDKYESIIGELIVETFEKHVEEIDNTILEFDDFKNNNQVKEAVDILNSAKKILEKFLTF